MITLGVVYGNINSLKKAILGKKDCELLVDDKLLHRIYNRTSDIEDYDYLIEDVDRRNIKLINFQEYKKRVNNE